MLILGNLDMIPIITKKVLVLKILDEINYYLYLGWKDSRIVEDIRDLLSLVKEFWRERSL